MLRRLPMTKWIGKFWWEPVQAGQGVGESDCFYFIHQHSQRGLKSNGTKTYAKKF
jgi:hypothetical protein